MAQAVKYLIGDTREQIATIADGSVSLVACSPPFIALDTVGTKHLALAWAPLRRWNIF